MSRFVDFSWLALCREFLAELHHLAPPYIGPRRVHLVAFVAGAVGGFVAPALADPLNPLNFPSLGKVTLASGAYTIDTTGEAPMLVGPATNLTGRVSASGVAVFRFDDLIVKPGAVFTGVEGKATRPVALLASGNLAFAGTLYASGSNGGTGTHITSGVGGEGRFGGGNGTGARAIKPGGVAGPLNDVEPNHRLVGGNGGGGGLFASGTGGGGGGGAGGGAVELGALGALTLTGSILDARGGNGGDAGDGTPDLGSGGGGGGSGGAVFLHAPTVTLGGTINARGGSGGKGRGLGNDGGGGSIAIHALAMPDTPGTSIEGGFTDKNGRQRRGIVFAQPTLKATNLDFGSVRVGSTMTVNMTIQNTGTSGSFINGQFPAASVPFARVESGIFSGLKENAPATCAYTFTPAAVGHFTQTLKFLSNAGPVSVTVSGTGIKDAD